MGVGDATGKVRSSVGTLLKSRDTDEFSDGEVDDESGFCGAAFACVTPRG